MVVLATGDEDLFIDRLGMKLEKPGEETSTDWDFFFSLCQTKKRRKKKKQRYGRLDLKSHKIYDVVRFQAFSEEWRLLYITVVNMSFHDNVTDMDFNQTCI